ncbi:MAG: right-handed parallel beta-helix repeat-containing protein, partial [Gemmataceae bacterium]|nr:right-handed parallel beta-helix repeat-containing protein [Gemmataceae bacterium]
MRLLAWIARLLGVGPLGSVREDEQDFPLYVTRLEDRQVLDATLAVTTTADVMDGNTTSISDLQSNPGADGKISLREAVIAANNTAGDDTILLDPGTYELTIAGANENAAATGDLDVLGSGGKLTIQGAGADQTTIDANSIDRIFELRPGANLTVEGVTLTGGDASGNSGSNSKDGGAILVKEPGQRDPATTLTLNQTAVEGNTTDGRGGGVAGDKDTFVVVRDSTISDNFGKLGGGGINVGGDLKLINSTVSGNSVDQGNSGGGVAIDSNATAKIVNSTITENVAQQGGGVSIGGSAEVEINNTIVAWNLLGDERAMTTEENVKGAFTGSNNFTEDNPKLGPLANNGGPTKTHLPQNDSQVINAGSDALARDPTTGTYPTTSTPLVYDQRGEGFPRFVGTVDIGAVETAVRANNPPAGTDKIVTTDEDTAYTFTAADFGFTDPNDSPADAFLAVKITTLPSDGVLKLNGVAVTAGQFVLVTDIDAGKLKFFPDANE